MKIRKLFLLTVAVALSATTTAQESAPSVRKLLAANPELTGCLYHSYEYLPGEEVPAPKGYKPFYISHYGRHGSRYHTSAYHYQRPLAVLRHADSASLLTERGRLLLEQFEQVVADADGRLGMLTPRGVREHRAIAERMFKNYPEVFSTRKGRICRIQSRSTMVPRCILSMAAFNERLKELNPAIQTERESSERHVRYLSNGAGMDYAYHATKKVADSLKRATLHPERLMQTIFTEPDKAVKNRHDAIQWMYDLFIFSSILQDVDFLGLSFYDLFTEEELYTLWRCENARRYLGFGPSKRFGDGAYTDAAPLLRNFVETADQVIAGEENLSASLRFGHDSNLMPLAALMGVEIASVRVWTVDEITEKWLTGRVSPMAANLQMIFFRHERTGDIRVRILYNERDANLPLAGGPYYPWPELRDYLKHRYEHPELIKE